MKHFGLVFCLIWATNALFSQINMDSAYIREHYTKREVYIPMRDGKRLFTSIYTPKDATKKYPILLKRTPYSCAPYGTDAFVTAFQNMYLAKSGYIFVTQDVRGRHMSEGEYVDVRPFIPNKSSKTEVDEASDTYDAAKWLIQYAASNNGRIGVYGISYPGFYSTMAILAEHPAIRAVSPQAPVTDWFDGDDFHHNGAFFLMDGFHFYSGFGQPRPEPRMAGAPGFSQWNTPDAYDFYLKAGALRHFKERYGMQNVGFWQDLMNHPNKDAWWQARNPRPHLKNVKPAVLTVGGLFDAEDCFGAWEVYKSIEKQNPITVSNRLVMGPWSHGGWARGTGEKLGNVSFGSKTSDYFQREVEFPFFEHYLKDAPDNNPPDALIFETGSNKWTSYDTWPPRKMESKKYYFQQNGGLTPLAPSGADAFDEYVSDPSRPVPYTEDVHLNRTREYMTDDQRFAARRPDVLVYQTPVLTESVTAVGPVMADIWLSTTGTDADLVVKLIDVFPDTLSGVSEGVPLGGYQMLVRGEIMRVRYRNSKENPEAMVPGKPEKVRFALPDVAHTFLPGHKIMVQVQSSWFPLVDRNPQQFVDIYHAKDSDFIKATHRVYFDAAKPSGIELGILKKNE